MLVGYQQLASPRSVAPVTASAHADGAVSVATEGAPEVEVRAIPTDAGGWQLDLQLERFEITPMGDVAASADSADGSVRRGHVHLYVNGQMKGMIFSNRHEVDALPPGEHVITVELSTMDHRTLMVNGEPIRSRITVVQPAARRS